MKTQFLLAILVATVTSAFAEKPLPLWLSAKELGIYKVLDIKRGEGASANMTVSVNLLHQISGDLTEGKSDVVIKPLSAGRISMETELWSYKEPGKNENYLVFGDLQKMVSPALPSDSGIYKKKITEQEIEDIVFCAAVNDSKETTPVEKAGKLASYLKEKKSVSRYFWLYCDYLICNYDDMIDIIKESLPHLLTDYEDVHWIGDQMIDYGMMGRITPSHRAFALQILTSYVSQKEQPEKVQYRDAIWIMRYPGDYAFTEEALKDFKAAKKIYTTNQPGFAKDIRAAIMKVVNKYT